MLETLNRLWTTFRARSAVQRLAALALRSARGNPVRTRLAELCTQADARGIDTLTARQQLVVRTWAARGIVGNGGFGYFLEGTQPLGPVAEGFRALGFGDAAAACESVMAKVAARPQLTEAARREAIVDAAGARALDAEESAVFDVAWDELEAAIDRYMRSNPRDFPGVR